MTTRSAAAEWGFPNAATPPGSAPYYSVRLSPGPLRDDLATLLGWRHEIHAVLGVVSDPSVAAAKLDWWRQELERVFGGGARHPLSQRLTRLVERSGLPAEPFLEVIQAAAGVLSRNFPQDQAAWISSAEADLGSIAELIARRFGRTDPGHLDVARALGTYCALVERLRDAGWLLRRGRLGILPSDQLRTAGLTPERLASPAERTALPDLLAEAGDRLTAFAASLGGIDEQSVTLRIYARLQRCLLAELEAADYDVLDQRIAVTPIRKLWHAWRESRHA